jgi:hypothetical protein
MSSILNVCRSLTICILLANFIRSSRAGGEVTNAAVMSYLQQESAAVTSAQHAVQQMLLSKNIPVGLSPLATQALRTHRKLKEVEEPYRIALSTDDNDITCRISLVNVPVGKKCVAPCGCSGSQEWVQFTELNRLRRLDPSQWTVCQTCRKKFDYSSIQMYGGVKGNIISLLLDNMKTVRIAGVLIVAAVYSLLHLNSLVLRFLTSKFFWQMVIDYRYLFNIYRVFSYNYIYSVCV